MSSDIYVCAKCYDPQLMGRWEEYTGAAFQWRTCVLCGDEKAKHWFASPRGIIRDLVRQVRAAQPLLVSIVDVVSSAHSADVQEGDNT
jgi:hypothetical protein